MSGEPTKQRGDGLLKKELAPVRSLSPAPRKGFHSVVVVPSVVVVVGAGEVVVAGLRSGGLGGGAGEAWRRTEILLMIEILHDFR